MIYLRERHLVLKISKLLKYSQKNVHENLLH